MSIHRYDRGPIKITAWLPQKIERQVARWTGIIPVYILNREPFGGDFMENHYRAIGPILAKGNDALSLTIGRHEFAIYWGIK